MRYYHYISNAKAEMLFPQIPPDFLSSLKVELGFNFGLLTGKLGGEQRDPTTAVARVQAIEKFFEEKGLINTGIMEATWLRARFNARIGFLQTCPGLVLFGGRIRDVVLILAGSEAHLISGSADAGKDKGWSFMPRTLHALKNFLLNDFDLLDVEGAESDYLGLTAESLVFGTHNDMPGSMFRAFLSLPEDSLPEPSIDVLFLARIFLVRTNNRGETFALGSPLYVAE
jgi:hypothetical protein